MPNKKSDQAGAADQQITELDSDRAETVDTNAGADAAPGLRVDKHDQGQSEEKQAEHKPDQAETK